MVCHNIMKGVVILFESAVFSPENFEGILACISVT